MKKLFLDDVREPKDCLSYMKYNLDDYRDEGWDIVRNFEEFKKYIENCGPNNLPSLISFDHDLADEHYTPEIFWNDYTLSKKHQESKTYTEKTGDDCAEFLVKYIVKHGVEKEYMPDFLIHSANPVGRDRIAGTLKQLENPRFIQVIKTEIFYDDMLEKGTTINRGGYIPGIRTPIATSPITINPITTSPFTTTTSPDLYRREYPIMGGDPFKYPTIQQYSDNKKKKVKKAVRTKDVTSNPFNPPGYDDEKVEVKEEKKEKVINKATKKDLLIAGLVIFGSLLAALITAFF